MTTKEFEIKSTNVRIYNVGSKKIIDKLMSV